MAGTKRSAEGSGRTTRASKVAKTVTKTSPTGKKEKKTKAKAKVLPTSQFKEKALPLHVNITHTPPSIPDKDSAPAAKEDPGFLGSLTLVPSSFATGSYGWKGSKRVTVELLNDEGQKEKVQVMLTFNATVMGSKGAAEDGDEKEDKGDEKEQKDDEKDAQNDADE